MQLKRLISLANETEGILQKYSHVYEVKEFDTLQDLKLYIETIQSPESIPKKMKAGNKDFRDSMYGSCYIMENIEYRKLQECLLIAATDETISWAKSVNVAILAYENPNICGQALSQVEMLVQGFEEVDAEFLKRVWQRYYHIPWTIAVTDRCIIRELTLDDMDALFELYQDKEVTRFTEGLFDKEEETDYQRAYINNMYRYFGYGMWLVFHKETGELIGRAGLEHREYGEELELELGYLIGAKYQRKGYATEVCKAIIEYAKEEIGALTLNCLIEEENTASIALAKKLGFVFWENFEQRTDNSFLYKKIKKMLRYHILFDSKI